MAFQELNTSEISFRTIFQFPNLDTPEFWPLILFAIFAVFTFGTFFRELLREGRANFLSSMAVGGFVTITIAAIMTLLEVINTTVFVVTLVSCGSLIVLFLLTNRNIQ